MLLTVDGHKFALVAVIFPLNGVDALVFSSHSSQLLRCLLLDRPPRQSGVQERTSQTEGSGDSYSFC
jgi:hypothetical protein